MNRTTRASRRSRIVAALALVLVAALSCVAAPRQARAAESGFTDTPLCDVEGFEEIKDAPGFEWVSAEDSEDHVPHYLISNPVGEEFEGSTESGIGWWYFSYYSRLHSFSGYLIRLDSDLSFSQYDFNRDSGDPNQLSVGSKDLPFAGTFDGCGHTISNLSNEREGLSIQLDNGFFGWTNEATIKNITFKDCYIGGSYRDGLVAGYAQDTFFLNIVAENCTTSVIPANNVLNLITNAGISGGTIAGVANGCTLYNCEMRGGRVVSNSTAGVAALGGQPLYMGGLVGFANDSTIEYSRVTDRWVKDENGALSSRDYAEVSGTYETSVSVANYSEVFCGGIVGGIQKEDTGTKIVDCYSTADVYGKAAIYFGVGLGLGVTRAYCGGIAGIVWDGGGGENLIERVHYAGNLHSYQYNILLLGIPIIEIDAYMGGIVSVGGPNATINQAYFMRGASSTDKEILSYQNWTTDTDGPADGAAFGPRDESYTDRDYWEGCDFDFAAGTLRNYGYDFTGTLNESEWSENHYNKWVMDYNRGIPVHGGSIKATFDFPGSGEVTIGHTGLAWGEDGASAGNDGENTQKTTNSYVFAVQGFEQNDKTISLSYVLNENDKNDSWAADASNEGYRIIGWYGTRDVRVNDIPADHTYFTTANTTLDTDKCGKGILSTAKVENAGALGDSHASDEKHLVKANENEDAESFDLEVNWPIGDEAAEDWRDPGASDDAGTDGADGETKPHYPEYADNDLYIAHAQAQVLLHDVAGNVINKDGSAEESAVTSDDWYEYEEKLTLPEIVEADKDKVAPDVTFVGWTTKVAEGGEGQHGIGYANATPTDIAELRGDNALFEPGATYTVTEPVNLYPVYVGLTGNVTVVFEGNDQDPSDDGGQYTGGNDVSKRDGYGQAVVRTDGRGSYIALDDISSTQGVETDNDQIDLVTSPLFQSYDAEDTATSPDRAQMRFLGWYEEVTDGGKTFEVRVSDEPKFYLTDVDLTQHHTYTARFEYCVRYWWGAGDADVKDYEPYALDWVRFGADRSDPSLDGTGNHNFGGWLTGGHAANSYVLNPGDATSRYANKSADTIPTITFPLSFHGIWNNVSGDADVEVHTDFPTGPKFTLEYGGSFSDNLIVDMPMDEYDDYNFHLWTGECENSDWKDTSKDPNWNAGNHYNTATYVYWFNAHVTADVQFHGTKSGTKIVQRRYENMVFAESDTTYEYLYHYEKNNGTDVSVIIEASPSDSNMAREGYIFLGWIDKNLITEDEFNYIFNGNRIEGTDVNVVKDVDRALPYLVTSNEKIEVRHPMDFYPVYMGFDLETTTNVAQAGVDPDVYNIPGDPGITDTGAISADTVSVDYNPDGGTLVADCPNPVNISYDEDGGATIDIVAAVGTKVWKDDTGLTDEQQAETYELVSLTVTKDGQVVDTLSPTEVDEGSTTYTFAGYAIEAGSSYVFTANYSPVPVMVVYHLRADDSPEGADDAVDAFTAKVGDVLPSTKKSPWFEGYDDDNSLTKNEFFIGWTVGGEEGKPVEWVEDGDPVLARPKVDTVTGTTHLWPVYRSAEITVQSNIDNEGGVPEDNTHRRATKHAGDSANLWLEADEVPGYEFRGWTTSYNTETGKYDKLFTTGVQAALSGDARFNGATYTAIYEKVAAQVRYHDMDGNVIYTASVSSTGESDHESPDYDPAGDPERSFVYTTQVDDDGNPGTPPVGKMVPVDTEAFTAIYAAVDAKNAEENADTYMSFVTWQLIRDGNEPQRWGATTAEDSFVTTPIKDQVKQDDNVLDLYPIVATIKATDPEDNAYTALTPQFMLDTEDNSIEAASITLRKSYGDEYLRVHLDEVAYAPNEGESGEAASTDRPLEGVPVKLYGVGSSLDEPLATDTTRKENGVEVDLPSGGKVTLNRGDAIFTFSGFINITKRTQDPSAAGQTFTFTVSAKTSDGSPATTRKVTVQVGETAFGGWYTGTAKIAVPFGTYTVSEDDGWSWRYNASLATWVKDGNGSYVWSDEDNKAEVTVTYTSEPSQENPDGATSAVRATNERVNNKWSDGGDYKHNVFNTSNEGSGE